MYSIWECVPLFLSILVEFSNHKIVFRVFSHAGLRTAGATSNSTEVMNLSDELQMNVKYSSELNRPY